MRRVRRPTPVATLIAASLALTACDSDPADPTAQSPSERAVAIAFDAVAGGASVRCGDELTGVGTGASTLTLADLRLYVHDVHLLTAAGEAVPVTLDEDGLWQGQGVALLDFEDGSGACANGTAPTNAAVTGTVPAGAYTGLRFTVGVPDALNHLDVSTAAPPLNVSGMFWSWQNGYKYLRLDGATPGQPDFRVHLGATGCVTEGPADFSCASPNLATVTLDAFDVDSDTVVLDVLALVAGLDVDTNAPPAPGCMGNPADPDCGAVFEALGMDDASGAAQTVFRRGP